MSIMLGNLSIAEMEARLGITFPDETREALAAVERAHTIHDSESKFHEAVKEIKARAADAAEKALAEERAKRKGVEDELHGMANAVLKASNDLADVEEALADERAAAEKEGAKCVAAEEKLAEERAKREAAEAALADEQTRLASAEKYMAEYRKQAKAAHDKLVLKDADLRRATETLAHERTWRADLQRELADTAEALADERAKREAAEKELAEAVEGVRGLI